MNRLFQINRELDDLRKEAISTAIQKKQAETRYQERILEITPPEGWEGKNDTQRKHSEAIAVTNDETLAEIRLTILHFEEDLQYNESDQQKLHDERRAIEWTVRMQMVGLTFPNHPEERPDNAFDDQAQAEIDEQIVEEIKYDKEMDNASQPELENVYPDDEIPF